MTNPDNNVLSTTEMATIREAYQAARSTAMEIETTTELLNGEVARLLRRLTELNLTLPTFDLDDPNPPTPTAAS